MSVDETADAPKAIAVLKEKKATFPAYIKPNADLAVWLKGIDTAFEGSIPRTYLLDKSGRVRKVITGPVDEPQMQKLIVTLLKEKPSLPSKPSKKGLLGGA